MSSETSPPPVATPAAVGDNVHQSLKDQHLPMAPEDPNPRSPKRRRISPDVSENVASHTSTNVPAVGAQAPPVTATPTTTATTSTATTTATPQVTAPSSIPPVAGVQESVKRPQPPAPDIAKLRLDNLPVLDDLSSRILSFLAKLTPADAMGLSHTPDSTITREYRNLRSTFEQTRRMFWTGTSFLSPKDLGLQDPNHVNITRKANQAIFMSSIFTGEIGLRDMDRSFLPVFVPEGGKLLKAQASIYLDLKTQGFITAWRTNAAPPHVVMADLFGPDIDKSILARRPGSTELAPSEVEFLQRLTSRRDVLLADVKNNTLDQLPTRYKWEDFSSEVSSYLTKTIEAARLALKSSHQGQMEGQFAVNAPVLPVSEQQSTQSVSTSLPIAADDFVAQAARAAEIAMQGAADYGLPEITAPVPSPQPATNTDVPKAQPPPSEQQNLEIVPEMDAAEAPPSEEPNANPNIPHASQTAPTAVLYERARQVATAKAAKPIVVSQRRPWTTEEENALMTGLDQVKGPHWSQILAMYGPGGTVNEALKDRNQVQLKDKARNLKLFFLKAGIEVPYYLKYVTGDLRTRAPSQASKLEAKESERQLADEDRGLYDGLQGPGGLAGTNGESGGENWNDQSPPPEESEPMSPQAETAVTVEPSMDDVEAMIARAAAQASQNIGPDGEWM